MYNHTVKLQLIGLCPSASAEPQVLRVWGELLPNPSAIHLLWLQQKLGSYQPSDKDVLTNRPSWQEMWM